MYLGVKHFRYFLEGRDFIKGKDNAVADTLSRHILATPLGVDFSMLA